MIEVLAPSRLHFGLLAFDPAQPRQFGGVGVMVRQPSLLLRAEHAQGLHAEGLLADKAVVYARRFLAHQMEHGHIDRFDGLFLRVVRAPRPHTGLGSGTQLGMAVATALTHLLDLNQLTLAQRARAVGRGKRSAIGAWGFELGGLIVEGGKRSAEQLSPLLLRLTLPAAWRVVLIRPRQFDGLSGVREQQAFDQRVSIPAPVSAELCRLVLLGLAPAAQDGDLPAFGEALYELQTKVGDCFAPAQGGRWADPLLGAVVDYIRAQGVAGVGQSSWGPTLYAFCPDPESAEHLADRVQAHFQLQPQEVRVTEPDAQGALVRQLSRPLSNPPLTWT